MSAPKTQLKRKKTKTSVINNDIVEERLDMCLSAGNSAWWEMDCKTGKIKAICLTEKGKKLLQKRPTA